IGVPAPEGTAEIIAVLAEALDAAGLRRAVIGLGDADLYRQLLDEFEITGPEHDAILDSLSRHDLISLGTQVEALAGLDPSARETLLRLTGLRGGREVLERAHGLGGEAVERATARLAATYAELERRG